MKMQKDKQSNILKTLLKVVLWVVGIIVALMIILEIVLSGAVLTKIVNKYAAEYVDGNVNFGKASISLFRRFPATVLTLEDFSITYPSERFDSLETLGPQGHLVKKGCSQQADTLASFKRFSVGISLPALLSGTIKVPYLRWDKPRIFAHSYADGSANWDIFRLESSSDEEEPEDTTASDVTLPKIVIGKIMMTGNPQIVYTSSRDTIFAMINLRKLELNGHIDSKRINKSDIGLTLDSLFVAGRVAKDTLAFGLDRLYLHEKEKGINVDLSSKAFLATRDFGRIKVPVNVCGTLSFPQDSVTAIRVSDMDVNIAHIPLKGETELRLHHDRAAIKGQLGIEGCKVDKLLESYISHIIPEAAKVETNAVLNISASIDGSYDYGSGQLPQMSASISVPKSNLRYSDLPQAPLSMEMKVGAEIDKRGKINIDINRIKAEIPGLLLSADAQVKDIMCNDPKLTIDGSLDADLLTVKSLLPEDLGIDTEGALHGSIKGSAKLSELTIYNFSSSTLTGEVTADNIKVQMPQDSINAVIAGLKITLGPEKISSRRDPQKTFSLVGLKGEIAKADIQYGSEMSLQSEDLVITAKNSMNSEIKADSIAIYPFSGRISASRLNFKDSEGTSLRLAGTSNRFSIFPKRGNPSIPVLTLSSSNKKVFVKYGTERVALSDANMKVNASMNSFERKRRLEAFVDSLAVIYPYIPKDSLVRHHFAQFRGKMPAGPRGFKEDDFTQQDLDISLDKSIAKYFNEWDIAGNMEVGNSYLMTPSFPLRNNLKGFGLNFTNDRIIIDSLKMTSGKSDISATGRLTGLKRALLGRKGALKLKMEIVSEKMDANELLAAYSKGASITSDNADAADHMDDEEFMDSIVLDSTSIEAAPELIVVPRNINAEISLIATNIDYSKLHVDLACSDMIMKDRCVQIGNTQALTNMGEIHLEGFYATLSKEDIKAGFCLNFKDITAEKVIDLMPSVDTLMPLLKSFGGNLNCELAATARLDTNMNVIMPSINGIMRMGGDDLFIKDNEMFRKMAKMLIFKNKKEGHIDKMTVEGVIKDSKVEVFPFILEMDRYMLGLSGIQNMDMSYRYHASLIKSPFLLKVGMDIFGPDFDNMKFKIGRPKYKNRNVPAFSAVIDKSKINLLESIRNVFDKGVDAIMKESSEQSGIEEHKRKIGYVQAVDQNMEELSAEEQQEYETQQIDDKQE